ncbi:hypothetical protein ACH4U7_34400 [Streptomyces sp. NPDC020845]|uniref:hypothetical protein n=1 Tax=Streptomyces sp. NPDC020845 TaxID=3365096 RepID=UPI0037A88CD1
MNFAFHGPKQVFLAEIDARSRGQKIHSSRLAVLVTVGRHLHTRVVPVCFEHLLIVAVVERDRLAGDPYKVRLFRRSADWPGGVVDVDRLPVA